MRSVRRTLGRLLCLAFGHRFRQHWIPGIVSITARRPVPYSALCCAWCGRVQARWQSLPRRARILRRVA